MFRGARAESWAGRPMGIAWGADTLYICDISADCVHAWNLKTGEARRLGGGGELKKPVAVAVDHTGTVYVADTVRGEVVAFSPSAREFGLFKPDDRDAYRPVAVAVSETELFVADMTNHRVDVYSVKTGRLSRSFGGAGSGPGEFYYPSGIAIGRSGELCVADMMNARVQVLDPEGGFIRSIGEAGDGPVYFGKPKAVAIAPDDTVLVADAESSSVHLFDNQGRLLLVIGGPRDAPGGTPLPNGMVIAKVLPESIEDLLPAGFRPRYYLFVANTAGRKRLALFAVGEAVPARP